MSTRETLLQEPHLQEPHTTGDQVLRGTRLWLTFPLLSVLVFLFAFRGTWLGMLHTWYSSRTFSHCFLIVPCCAYLVWLRRDGLARCTFKPNFKAVPLIAVLASLWLVGNLADARMAQEFFVVCMFIALVWAFLGTAVARTLRFPLAFLFFAVPFGVSLVGPLQDFTAWFTVHALNLTNIPAVLENRTLSLPSAVWTVAEACSGIRYLFASVVSGTFVASLIYRSRIRQLLLVSASLFVPVLANGVRAYLIVTLAYLTGNRLAVSVDHVVYGGLFFVIVQTALIALALRWREVSAHEIAPASVQHPSANHFGMHGFGKQVAFITIAVIAVCVVTPLWANHLWQRSTETAPISQPSLVVAAPWQPAPSYDESWATGLVGADQSYRSTYSSGNREVQMSYALFTGHRSIALIDSYNLFAEPKLWSVVNAKFRTASIDGRSVVVHESVFTGPAARTVWTWYWVSGEYTCSASRLKWLQAKARLLGRPVVVVALTVASDNPAGDPIAAGKTLDDFVKHMTISPPREQRSNSIARSASHLFAVGP